jgi:acetyltransferase-like isoleucine patch superfamily enzyme
MVSTSPVFYAQKNIFQKVFYKTEFQEFDSVEIGNDVWIGSHALIKGGVTIGNGAIIGAYSIVTKDVEPFTIVAGNPAHVIRKRFHNDEINFLQKIQWWNLSDQKLKEYGKYFNNMELFLKSWENA